MDDSKYMRKSYLISKWMYDSYQERDFVSAKTYVKGALLLASKNPTSWDHDNVIHIAYTILGLIAIEEGDIEEAKRNLTLSSAILGSPQIKAIGPEMTLAKKLLKLGETDAVLRYFELCKKFWPVLLRFGRLKRWKKAILRGEKPDFKMNLGLLLKLHQAPRLQEKYG